MGRDLSHFCQYCTKGVALSDRVFTAEAEQISDKIKRKYPMICKECFAGFVQQGDSFDKGPDVPFKILSEEEYTLFQLSLDYKKSKWYEYYKVMLSRPTVTLQFTFENSKEATAFKTALYGTRKKFTYTFKVQQAGKHVVIRPTTKENKNEETI